MGKYFDELNIGDQFRTRSRTVTEADIVNFAGVSGDFNEAHTNEQFAKQQPYGGRIAHGHLTLAISSGLKAGTGITEGTTIAFLELRARFLRPVKPGDTITSLLEVTDKKATKKPGRGIVVFKNTVINQRNEPVVETEEYFMMMCSPST